MRNLLSRQSEYQDKIGQVIKDLKTKVKLILEQRGININEKEATLTKEFADISANVSSDKNTDNDMALLKQFESI